MLAARCNAYGPPDSIAIETLADPQPASDQAVVAVRAASVNFPDVLIAANRYQVSVPTPFTPGSEFAGVVDRVGDAVRDVKPGDAVVGTQITGAFAERIAISARNLSPLPAGLSFAEAASFSVTGLTAYSALCGVAAAKRGEWVVVLGAAGGVGSAALDVARQIGCRTIAVASTQDKLAACRAWGAEAALLSSHADLRQAIREVTGGGADVVIDPVGGPLSEISLRALRFGGRFVTLGYASGEIPRIPLNLVLLKGAEIRGLDLRTYGTNAPDRARSDAAALTELVARGLRPRIGAVFALRDVAAALTAVAGRQSVGKVVLEMP